MTATDKSIEALENSYWGEPEFSSYVAVTCHRARQKPLSKLSNEEIRCLIGQKIGLKYLLPIAVGILNDNIFTEVRFFKGDLLLGLLRLDINDWKDNQNDLENFTQILRSNKSKIDSCRDIDNDLLKKYI